MEWSGDVAEGDVGLAVRVLVHGLGTGGVGDSPSYHHDSDPNDTQLCAIPCELEWCECECVV